MIGKLAPLLLLLAACGPGIEHNAVYQEVPDALSEGGSHSLSLTVAWPDAILHGIGPYPAVLFLHGGGWMMGTRSSGGYNERVVAATGAGYVGVRADYRLTSHEDEAGGVRFPWPAQIQDVKCAVRWLRTHADELDIDPEHIVAAGHSAGGHLAMMLALSEGEERFESPDCRAEASSAVSGAVSRSGISDLGALLSEAPDTAPEPISRLLAIDEGEGPDRHPNSFGDASPVSWSHADAAPILHLQGLADDLVPPSNARRMVEAQEDAGAPHLLWEHEGTGHIWRETELARGDSQLRAFLGWVFDGTTPDYLCSPWPSCGGSSPGLLP